MEVIPINTCTKIGYLQKLHSIHGELVLNFEPKYEDSIHDASTFFVEQDGLLVPFFIEENGIRFRSNKTANLKFEWVDSEKAAKLISGSSVYLKTDEIKIPNGIFSIDEYKDFMVVDAELGEVGTIDEINDYGGNIVLSILRDGDEILVPFNEELLISIDHKKQQIILDLPSGLIDLETRTTIH